jgi:hypothetical protein
LSAVFFSEAHLNESLHGRVSLQGERGGRGLGVMVEKQFSRYKTPWGDNKREEREGEKDMRSRGREHSVSEQSRGVHRSRAEGSWERLWRKLTNP